MCYAGIRTPKICWMWLWRRRTSEYVSLLPSCISCRLIGLLVDWEQGEELCDSGAYAEVPDGDENCTDSASVSPSPSTSASLLVLYICDISDTGGPMGYASTRCA